MLLHPKGEMPASVLYPICTDQAQRSHRLAVVDLAACSSHGSSTVLGRNTKQKKMEHKEELSNSASKITDDLIVEILSWLPFKSFCRFKCVCKSWLAFSSDPHYCHKLPKVPTGFFYQDCVNSAFQLASLSKNHEGIDGTLSFLPHYEQLKLIDCCNGLVLCEYKSSHTSPHIFRFIVCNPATREWRILPDTQRNSEKFCYTKMLCFEPSRSLHFCVFIFHEERVPSSPLLEGTRKVEMFLSRNSMWHVYSDLWDPEYFRTMVYCTPHLFLDGYLFAHSDRDVLVLEELKAENIDVLPANWTIEFPCHRDDCIGYECSCTCTRGCLGHSLGMIHYAMAEEDGCTVLIWSYATSDPNGWTLEHSLSMRDAFGRDDFVHYKDGWFWTCNYEVIDFDVERDVVFLVDGKTNKLLSYCISTGKLNEIKDSSLWNMYYVACYLKIPDLTLPKT